MVFILMGSLGISPFSFWKYFAHFCLSTINCKFNDYSVGVGISVNQIKIYFIHNSVYFCIVPLLLSLYKITVHSKQEREECCERWFPSTMVYITMPLLASQSHSGIFDWPQALPSRYIAPDVAPQTFKSRYIARDVAL